MASKNSAVLRTQQRAANRGQTVLDLPFVSQHPQGSSRLGAAGKCPPGKDLGVLLGSS